MKRPPQHDKEDTDNNSDDGELMLVEEEKIEQVPFLDTFYGLSSIDPQERAEAAQDMIQHCFLGPQANTKDAAYALKRLLNALCSGRAAARQGNASALVAFLKVAQETNTLQDIQKETKVSQSKQQENPVVDAIVSDRIFVRNQLLAATTEPGDGRKKKGSEERDYVFGRLFGILAIQKSGMLLPSNSSDDMEEVVTVSKHYISDLIQLFQFKKWMKESAAHAICMLLNSYYYASEEILSDAKAIVDRLVRESIVPELLSTTLSEFSAEQLAVAIHIQSHVHCHSQKLPAPLEEAVFSVETIPTLAFALSETSAVTQPRTHLVWDVIWTFLTETSREETSTKGSSNDVRLPRDVTPVGSESVEDVLMALIQFVVTQRLLGIMLDDEAKQHGESVAGKATHERRALALCIVRNLSGVEFVSSLTGRTVLNMTPSIMENVALNSNLVRRLFIDVIGAGTATGRKGKQAEHILKPFATQVLEFIVARALSDLGNDKVDVVGSNEMCLSILRGILRCDAHFDSSTKTRTISAILETKTKQFDEQFWISYIQFLEREVLANHSAHFVDLMYQAAKTLDKNTESATAADLSKGILNFFLALAFFDCSSVETAAEESVQTSGKKKKNKKKKSSNHAEISPIQQLAMRLNTKQPYNVRSVASARFFSLLSELQIRASQSQGTNKDQEILTILASPRTVCLELQLVGAKPLVAWDESSATEKEDYSPLEIVSLICDGAKKHLDVDPSSTKARFGCGLAILASVLYVHLLSCGEDEVSMGEDDLDADDDEDREEVLSFLSDVREVYETFSSEGTVDISSLAGMCTNIISSPLGAGGRSRGASPTLLREAVRIVWTKVLTHASSIGGNVISTEAVDTLLVGIGIDRSDEHAQEDDGDEESGDSEDENGVFVEATEVEDDEDSENSDDLLSKPSNGNDDDDSENDVEVDPSKLQSLLEQELEDDSVGEELEHHEGADAALAKLIQLKQEARKAGLKAKERLELSRQIKCTLLLETLLSGKPDGWGCLLTTDALLDIAFALLQYHRRLEKAIKSSSDKGSDISLSERKAMLARITSILKNKLFKFKLSSISWSSPEAAQVYAENMSVSLFQELRQSPDKEHQQLCSSAIVFLTRCIDSLDGRLEIAKHFAAVVDEWAHRRTGKLDASFFDHLIHQNPSYAQVSLTQELAKAAATARSAFLKSEAFRLLGLLHNPKLSTGQKELGELGDARVVAANDTVIDAVISAFEDPEMKKAKRIREVIKTLEKILVFLSAKPSASHEKQLDQLVELLKQSLKSSESKGIQSSCEKVISLIHELKSKPTSSESMEVENGNEDAKDDSNNDHMQVDEAKSDDESADENESSHGDGKKKKKSKSKKKKGKSKKK
ncbi:hypothetical protein FisN_20Lh124 [Fistulifera solaris]|uniref:DNA polymerase phi subunit n=1 Tax=Fistulifera solaris TaxID=1519565 RepID=A0A1Z5JD65_FISSO|nr:hypothetical protein FisN_20Lh124 [Fistulifera solaris]|eukprot:GAX11822.1 hypothetical protein FisN_20Lh124 [Fistulifera solaris]